MSPLSPYFVTMIHLIISSPASSSPPRLLTVISSAICLLTNSHLIICHLSTHKQTPHHLLSHYQSVRHRHVYSQSPHHLLFHHQSVRHHPISCYLITSQLVTAPSAAISSPVSSTPPHQLLSHHQSVRHHPISCCFTGSFNTMQSVPLSPAVSSFCSHLIMRSL